MRIVISEKHIQKLIERSKNVNRKGFKGYYCIEGVFYETSTEAGVAMGVHNSTVLKRVQNKFPNWIRT